MLVYTTLRFFDTVAVCIEVIKLELSLSLIVVVVILVFAREVVSWHLSDSGSVQELGSVADWLVGDYVLLTDLFSLEIISHPSAQQNSAKHHCNRIDCTGWPKKWAPFVYALTLPNINRFSKLFHSRNQEKICNNTITVTKDPTTPQVCRYTTL